MAEGGAARTPETRSTRSDPRGRPVGVTVAVALLAAASGLTVFVGIRGVLGAWLLAAAATLLALALAGLLYFLRPSVRAAFAVAAGRE